MSRPDVVWTAAISLAAFIGLGLLVRQALRDARPGPDDLDVDERGLQ